jgi:hypothetical protein
MTHAYRIRTIYLAALAPETANDEEGRKYIDSAILHVGDNNDPTKNPKCGGKVYDSGVYECNLVGKFVGISRMCSNDLPLGLVELMAFNTMLIDGKASVAEGTDMAGTVPEDDPCIPFADSANLSNRTCPTDSRWDGKKSFGIE